MRYPQLSPLRKDPQNTLVVLDYDGSHAPFVKDADKANMYPGLREMLSALNKRGYHLAFSSGRELHNLKRMVDLPFINNYAGSHGNQVIVRGEERGYQPRPHMQQELQQIYENEIIARIKPGFEYQIEEKPASVVLHWRRYCEEEGIRGERLKAFEQRLFDDHINPAIEAYNKTEIDESYHLKAENHGMNADISRKQARNKGDALDDFSIDRLIQKEPLFKNYLTVSDSLTDGYMIRRAQQHKEAYGTHVVNVVVEQESTPEWMLRREWPDIVLRADKEQDPDLLVGGIPQLKDIYEELLR